MLQQELSIPLNNGKTIHCAAVDVLLALMQMVPSERVSEFANLVEQFRDQRQLSLVMPNGKQFIAFDRGGPPNGH